MIRMASEVAFYPNGRPLFTSRDDADFINTYDTCMLVLAARMSFETMQMCLLMEPYVKEYDHIRIVNRDSDVVDIVNNHDGTWSCDRTDRVLRDGNDFYRLWQEGEFGL